MLRASTQGRCLNSSPNHTARPPPALQQYHRKTTAVYVGALVPYTSHVFPCRLLARLISLITHMEKLGPFAVLRPENQEAKEGCSAVYHSKEAAKHHRKFIRPRENGIDLEYFLELDGSNIPSIPKLGWTCGRGVESLDNRGVDLLLAPPDLKETGIAIAHFSLRPSINSGLLMASSDEESTSVYIDGDNEKLTDKSAKKTLHQRTTFIRAGLCLYSFEYLKVVRDESERYLKEMQAFIRNRMDPRSRAGFGCAFAPGSSQNVFNREYLEYGLAGIGTFGRVTKVVSMRSGRLFVMKDVRVTAGKEAAAALAETNTAKKFLVSCLNDEHRLGH